MTIAWRVVDTETGAAGRASRLANGAGPPPLDRGPAERLQAWVVTGPLGHLWSVLADLASYWSKRYLTDAGRGSRSSARR
jgi:hypothetical protein